MATLATFETRLVDTQKAMTLMMDTDVYPQTNRSVINSAFLAIIQSKSYVDKIISEIQQINADGKFTIADAPNVLLIITQSQATLKNLISNSVNLKISLQQDAMKYINYGVFHFVLLIENVSTAAEFDSTFGILWTLVAFNPASIVVKAKSLFSCCSSTPVKSSTEPTA
jgi:hypothetical protein